MSHRCKYIYIYVIYIYTLFIDQQHGHDTNTTPFWGGPRRSQLHHCAAGCAVRQAQVAPAADVREVCAVQETDLGGTWQLSATVSWQHLDQKNWQFDPKTWQSFGSNSVMSSSY